VLRFAAESGGQTCPDAPAALWNGPPSDRRAVPFLLAAAREAASAASPAAPPTPSRRLRHRAPRPRAALAKPPQKGAAEAT